ncbi:hypothetical protein P879_05607 [Paragonimus westermani]|uniref:IQ domain-containing protein E n=1 Tax=Paragonimus westermani TaxID=34504 RepID=A0A8T0DYW1_9TREM|nr:hypothetical protein P879_05607 [Paragonimus westermani]
MQQPYPSSNFKTVAEKFKPHTSHSRLKRKTKSVPNKHDSSLHNFSIKSSYAQYTSMSIWDDTKQIMLRKAPSSNCSPRRANGVGDTGKLPEDFVDEIIALKKKLAFQSSEYEALNFRCRQLKDSLDKKDKELAHLNNPIENAKLIQTLGDNRPQTVRIFRQLHQKIFRLEERLQEKENDYNRLVTDMKYTRVEELRIQLETAIEEVHRLQQENSKQSLELARLNQERLARVKKKSSDPELGELKRRISTMGKVIKGLDEQRQELLARNHHLMMRMQQILRNDDFPKSDLEQELEHLNKPQRASSPESHGEPDLVATIVESKLSTNLQYQHGNNVYATRVETGLVGELDSIRSQLNSFEQSNKQLMEERNFYKKQLELAKIQMDNMSEAPGSARTSEGSPIVRRSPKRTKTLDDPQTQSFHLTKEEESAVLIQRAWRAHRQTCLSMRSKDKQNWFISKKKEHQKEAAITLLKSSIHGHLSRQSCTSRSKYSRNNTDDSDTGTFVTEEGETHPSSEEDRSRSLTDLKAAILGHVERQRSLSSLQPSEPEQ